MQNTRTKKKKKKKKINTRRKNKSKVNKENHDLKEDDINIPQKPRLDKVTAETEKTNKLSRKAQRATLLK